MFESILLAQTDAEKLRFTADQVVSPYMWVFYVAFGVCFIATPIMRKLALANGVVDWPDHRRKAHLEPIAYLGGVALFLGWIAGVVVSFMIQPHTIAADPMSTTITFPASILIGAAIICGVGVIDDVYGISPRVKVGGQLLAAALLASQTVGTELAAGVIAALAHAVGLEPTIIPGFGAAAAWQDPAYWLGTVFVTLLVLGGCNALNLIDGLDGLSAGVTGIFAVGIGFIAVTLAMGAYGTDGAYSPFAMDPVRVVMCLALLGTVLGYLPYNFNPANIFMGDAGSLLLGYLSVSLILLLAEKGDPQLVMAGLIVFALPILDTSLAIVRRKMRGQPIFSPDNQHLHHQLIRAGLSVKKAVLSLYAAAAVFAAIGASLTFLRLRYVAAFFLVFFWFMVVMAYKIGHRQYLLLQARAAEAKHAEQAHADQPIGQDPVENETTLTPANPDAANPGVVGQA